MPFLLSPPSHALNSAETPQDHLTRRRFLRRTGGATVATFVALHMAQQNAEARVEYTNPSATGDHFQIRANGPENVTEPSVADHYYDTGLPIWVWTIRKITNSGTVTPWGDSATNDITITIAGGAQKSTTSGWVDINPGGDLNSIFPPSGPPSFTIACAITKRIDTATGEVIESTWTLEGNEPDDDDYDNTFAPEGGLSATVTTDFTGGKDKISVQNGGVSGVPGNTKSFEAIFEIEKRTDDNE
jgi:hypothetical protein